MNKEEANRRLGRLFRKKYRRLLGRAKSFRIVGHEDDILQETFVRALAYASTFTGTEKELEKWVTSIMWNAQKDIRREERNKGGVIGSLDDVEEYELAGRSMEEDLMTEEKVQDILSRMDGLDKDKRNAVRGFLVFGFSASEVAQYTGLSPANIRKVVQRFKEEMRCRYEARPMGC